MSSLWLCYFLPLVAVWTVGGCFAIARWQWHPRVSTLVLVALGSIFVATLGMQVGAWYLSRVAQGAAGFTSLMPYFGALGLGNMLLRTIAWAMIVTAIFGWRKSPRNAPRPPLQFSIRGLLILTFAVALLCAAGRAVVSWLGGVSDYWVTLADDLPISICWLCGGWLAIRRWRDHPSVSGVALAAILLSAFSFLAFHLVWISNLTSGTVYLVQWASLLSGLVAPIVWSLLLAAALGWRNDAIMASAQSASAPSRGP